MVIMHVNGYDVRHACGGGIWVRFFFLIGFIYKNSLFL